MNIKKGLIFCISTIITSNSFATDSVIGQTLQVHTHFHSIVGKPTWLLIVREMQTGRILPYQFDIQNNSNFWLAFTMGRSYQVTVSELKFGPYATIKNFCRLQNGVISGKSMWIVLAGDLSPDNRKYQCRVTSYND